MHSIAAVNEHKVTIGNGFFHPVDVSGLIIKSGHYKPFAAETLACSCLNSKSL